MYSIMLVGVTVGDPAGGIIDVHDGIDDGAGLGGRVLDHIADGVGVGVEESLDLWCDGHVHWIVRHCIISSFRQVGLCDAERCGDFFMMPGHPEAARRFA
jgi:hypothetical protein